MSDAHRPGPATRASTLRPVRASERGRALAVLQDAFRNDPAIGWMLLAEKPGFDDRLTRFLAWEHDWHFGAQQPVQGAFLQNRLAGIGYVIDPGLVVDAHLFAELDAGIRDACGDDCAERYTWLNNELERLFPDGPFHLLGFLGVHSKNRRVGIGTSLVKWTIDRCQMHSCSRGVLLDTGNPDNLEFYRNLGFLVIGRVDADPVTEWLLWRPRDEKNLISDACPEPSEGSDI